MAIRKNNLLLRYYIWRLPKAFKLRIKKFKLTKPDWEHAPYEVFCCREAVKIAKKLKTKEKVRAFKDLDVEEQYNTVALSHGHSGNTFGMSVALAYKYLDNPDGVILEHGALAVLVGCPEYGCPHPPPEYVIEMLSEDGQKKLREILEKKDCDDCDSYGQCDHQGAYKKDGKWCYED
ncbi:MAG: hypothetical protein KAS36_03880 [Anaerolineales bacterium]|nr:hypothetical protein [Anaerolineales bacterium]